MFDRGATWADVAWVKAQCVSLGHDVPLLVKGVLRPDDAAAALDAGEHRGRGQRAKRGERGETSGFARGMGG